MRHDNDPLTPFELFTPVLLCLILAGYWATCGEGMLAVFAYTGAAFLSCTGVAATWEGDPWDGEV